MCNLFQQCIFIAIWRRIDRKGWKVRESKRILFLQGKTCSRSESENFPTTSLYWCKGKSRRAVHSSVLVEREKLHDFVSFIQISVVLSTPFLLEHEKVFFKYLNYALKLNVFVFIFFSRNILSIFFFRGSFFLEPSLKL